ncbi:enhanced serine sensitivity protein SseB [Streptomyces qinzhouensis]|uniref:Enhanced serine sensitivity protein SseB n=1 Tax=Streptomyces qinzhouensis TaxID=2599401 RepID=A0A5B8INL4_9ACTN|nr:enhanced serine sensitivity protein SseB [Streptomyces qinzhouensis]QDY79139.1 enhanced serine sensitivity protein SseB [Streptomyces qinzhouensis]
MNVAEQPDSRSYGGAHGGPYAAWPVNELEETLAASLGNPDAGARLVEVLGRSRIWVPLPNGGGPDSVRLDLPMVEIGGAAYVPVFSSEEQYRACVGDGLPYTVAPARDFARGLPPQVGIVVNPDGTVGVPLPPPAVAELCRAGRGPLDGPASGGRVRLFEPDWQDDPVDFLAAASVEFGATGVVATARRGLASVEGDDPALFIGVQLFPAGTPETALDALGRALGRCAVRWPVNLVFLDLTEDPVADWFRTSVRPFFEGELRLRGGAGIRP